MKRRALARALSLLVWCFLVAAVHGKDPPARRGRVKNRPPVGKAEIGPGGLKAKGRGVPLPGVGDNTRSGYKSPRRCEEMAEQIDREVPRHRSRQRSGRRA